MNRPQVIALFLLIVIVTTQSVASFNEGAVWAFGNTTRYTHMNQASVSRIQLANQVEAINALLLSGSDDEVFLPVLVK